ncbi:MAG: aldehyde dehydrogenase [Lachnospiraceae bacterium]|nr:aldehyde dehydrogenase [Lachnospiraceae bacterium]
MSEHSESIKGILEAQRAYFKTGSTLPVEFRIQALKKLQQAILANEDRINAALKADLGKSNFESYMCELGMTLSEISHMLKHIRSYAREHTVLTPLAQFASRSYKKPCPKGNVLVMSPWNYPFLLTMDPLVSAIAAGNTVIVKPSAYSPATTELMKELIESCFPAEHVAVINGGREENQQLLDLKFDHIFFTGSQAVGKTVMEKAARHLTPVTLELGGKSPCIVDKSAKIGLAAKRIVFGKFLNCGQTCVAPDYVLCEAAVVEEFKKALVKQIRKQFGKNPLNNKNFGKMINQKHFNRVMSLIDQDKVIVGGTCNADTLQIAPTVMEDVTWEDAVMQEEIFGPVLPIITVEDVSSVPDLLDDKQKPLAFYLFSEDKKTIRTLTSRCAFGGGCVNDTIIHLATNYMGFGGVGESGMGSYHGKVGFDTFSHTKSIVDKKTWLDLPMRYQPYKGAMLKIIRMFLK